MTTTASTMMIAWLIPSMTASPASGSLTFLSTCSLEAPNAFAASTDVGATSRTPRSTSRSVTGNAYRTPATIPGTIETGIR